MLQRHMGLHTECTLNFSIWLQSVYHKEGRVYLNRSQELGQDFRFFFFMCFLSVLRCCLHGCLRPCRLNENSKPLMKSSGTGYTPNLTKLGGSVAKYTLINSMCVRKGRNTWKLKRCRKEGLMCWSLLSQWCWCICSQRKDSTRQQRSKTNWIFVDIFHHPLNKCDKCVTKANKGLILGKTMPKCHVL